MHRQIFTKCSETHISSILYCIENDNDRNGNIVFALPKLGLHKTAVIYSSVNSVTSNAKLYTKTYRRLMRILWRKKDVKEEQTVVIGSTLCTNNGCPYEIHPILEDADIDCFCPGYHTLIRN